MKVGVKKISELSGYSTATVSNVLNNKKKANKQTTETILQIAKELGYRQTSSIHTVKLVTCKKHGTILGGNPFFAALIDGVNNGCQQFGYKLELENLNFGTPEFEPALDTLLHGKSTALLLLATELDEEDISVFQDCDIPLMILDNWFDNMRYNCTLINNTDSIQKAINQLVDMGHKTVGYLKSSISINNFKARYYGYVNAMLEYDMPFNKDDYTVMLSPTNNGSYLDMLEYLDGNPKLPTVYFADNDIIALGAMKALQEKGFNIPEDISIIGFDDLEYCELSSPTLSTIRVFKEDIGVAAVMLLNSIINNPNSAKHKLEISTKFMERSSIRRIE